MNTFVEKPLINIMNSHKTIVCGVGINDSDYQVQYYVNGEKVTCPFYMKWTSMLNRCYGQKTRLAYKGCTVCDKWLVFSVFKKWMQSQDWKGKELDKDVLVPGNKIYSPNTCIFVTSQINTLIINFKHTKDKYPQGVCFHKRDNKFVARYSNNGKQKHLGYFLSVEKASVAYKEAKSQHIIKIANEQTDLRIKNCLLKHAKLLIK